MFTNSRRYCLLRRLLLFLDNDAYTNRLDVRNGVSFREIRVVDAGVATDLSFAMSRVSWRLENECEIRTKKSAIARSCALRL